MSTMEAIETKTCRLQEQAEATRAKKASATLDRMVDLMKSSGVTVADIEAHLGGKTHGEKLGKKKVATGAAALTAKYMNSKTGAKWPAALAWRSRCLVSKKSRPPERVSSRPLVRSRLPLARLHQSVQP